MSHYDDDVRCRKCGAVYDSISVSESGKERKRHEARIEAEGRLCPKHRAKKKRAAPRVCQRKQASAAKAAPDSLFIACDSAGYFPSEGVASLKENATYFALKHPRWPFVVEYAKVKPDDGTKGG